MKIVVRGTNWIGDAVMSVPALRELRRIFPDAQISLHTRTWADGLFRDSGLIDDIITFDPHKWRVKDVYDNSAFLSDEDFDLAILLPNSFESAVTMFSARVPRRFGYNKDLRGLLLTDPIPVPEWKSRRHEVFYYLHLIAEVEKRVLGRETVAAATPDITLDVSDERIEEARLKLNEIGVDVDNGFVAIGAGSTNSRAKRWPTSNFAQLVDMIFERTGMTSVLLGAGDEASVADDVRKTANSKLISLVNKTDLDVAMAILASADVMVSNDMGLAHISAAVGTPTLTIFGPTNEATTRPFSPLADVIRENVECSPCMLRDCPIDHRCMTRISPQMVYDRLEMLLKPADLLEDVWDQ